MATTRATAACPAPCGTGSSPRPARSPRNAPWHLIAFRGLRRGEACGQPWSDTHLDTHLDTGALTISTQLVVDGWEVLESEPKTDNGHRTVALDSQTVRVLKAHRARQAVERLEWGQAWVKAGMVFTQGKGKWLHPAWVSNEFDRLVESSGLPPMRLHDLRHGAATLALTAGAEMKTIQEMLGHSSIAITSDIYTSLLREADQKTAEAMAALVPRAGREQSGSTAAHASLTHMPAEVVELLGKLATTLEKAQVSG